MSASPTTRKVAGVSGLTGNPVVCMPSNAAWAMVTGATPDDDAPQLSQREKEVLDYITKGFTVQEIAGLMQLSHFTVKTFVRRIYSKLKVSSKAEAIFEARNHGLLS